MIRKKIWACLNIRKDKKGTKMMFVMGFIVAKI